VLTDRARCRRKAASSGFPRHPEDVTSVPRRWRRAANILSGSEPDAVASCVNTALGCPRAGKRPRIPGAPRQPDRGQDRAGLQASRDSSPRSRSQGPAGETAFMRIYSWPCRTSVHTRAGSTVCGLGWDIHLFFPPPSGPCIQFCPRRSGLIRPGQQFQVGATPSGKAGNLFFCRVQPGAAMPA